MKFCERMSSTNFGCDEMIGYPDNWVSRGIFLEAVKGESQTAEFQKKTGSGMAEMEKVLRPVRRLIKRSACQQQSIGGVTNYGAGS